MKRLPKGIFIGLVFLFLFSQNRFWAEAADIQYYSNVAVCVDGVELGVIPAFDEEYDNNLYISLKGLAYALAGTPKNFVPIVERRKITITTGIDETKRPSPWSEKVLASAGNAYAAKYELYLDETEKKYYSFILMHDNGYDAFLTPVSLAMMFDLSMEVTPERIEIDTSKPFRVSTQQLEESGYLQGVNSILIGDGSTGEVFYQFDQQEVVPIASTTKLMTYFVFMDCVAQGRCSLEDTVVISDNAAKLSNGTDGVLPMKAGTKVSVQELLYAMLLPSSNECALALAEHAAGSEKEFVALMNEKAAELGLENAYFYNVHGLPSYEDQFLPAKIQNHMTAQEMFVLTSILLDTYPQITQYTSVKKYHMDAFDVDLKNTNAVLYNMENSMGLKTGTTNKAGSCLVACVRATKDGKPHNLVTVLFGADGDASRGILSEIACRYAMEALAEGVADDLPADSEIVIPKDPEMVMKKLIRTGTGN